MKLLLFAISFCFSLNVFAQKITIPEAQKGTEYGAGVSEDVTFDIYSTDRIIKNLAKQDSLKDIVVQATVTEVCPKKGCWMRLKSTNDETVFVKMKDYAFFVPQSMVGKQVLIHGNVNKKTTSVKELQHYAEDAKKSQAEIEAITEAKTEYRILANGIKVTN